MTSGDPDQPLLATQQLPLSGSDAGTGSACLVVIRGTELGARAELGGVDLVIGRSAEAGFRLDDPGVSRQHCRIWRDGARFLLRDLGSTNQTFVNGAPVTDAELVDGDRIHIAETVFKFVRAGSVEERYHRELIERASVDALTGLLNRREFRQRLEQLLLRALDSRTALALAILDLDHFKAVNDTHGHQSGDVVLRGVGELVRSALGPDEIAGRLGGEEFAWLLPGRDISAAEARVDALRHAVEGRQFITDEGFALAVTVSAGIATLHPKAPTSAELLRRADAALYAAKASGRNRVAVAAEPR